MALSISLSSVVIALILTIVSLVLCLAFLLGGRRL